MGCDGEGHGNAGVARGRPADGIVASPGFDRCDERRRPWQTNGTFDRPRHARQGPSAAPGGGQALHAAKPAVRPRTPAEGCGARGGRAQRRAPAHDRRGGLFPRRAARLAPAGSPRTGSPRKRRSDVLFRTAEHTAHAWRTAGASRIAARYPIAGRSATLEARSWNCGLGRARSVIANYALLAPSTSASPRSPTASSWGPCTRGSRTRRSTSRSSPPTPERRGRGGTHRHRGLRAEHRGLAHALRLDARLVRGRRGAPADRAGGCTRKAGRSPCRSCTRAATASRRSRWRPRAQVAHQPASARESPPAASERQIRAFVRCAALARDAATTASR